MIKETYKISSWTFEDARIEVVIVYGLYRLRSRIDETSCFLVSEIGTKLATFLQQFLHLANRLRNIRCAYLGLLITLSYELRLVCSCFLPRERTGWLDINRVLLKRFAPHICLLLWHHWFILRLVE